MREDIELAPVNENRIAGDYVIIDLNVDTVASFGSPLKVYFSDKFSAHQWQNTGHTLGAGDRLLINIWETSSDGLFSTFDNKKAEIDAVVNEKGNIFVPYVGQLRADGKSVEQVRIAIGEGLKGKAVEPQVQVAISANESNNVVVVGEIASPGQYPVKLGGLRLLDVIAEAGGSKYPVYETAATISRNSSKETIRLNEVLSKTENNIWLLPNDTVEILHKPRTFTAFGAVKNNKHVEFDSNSLSI
ncbi:MAG: polysaccharide biosynthesis/export family protein, partial [Sneathiella sp.]